jgi:amino acid adenylation domain-containing protein
MSNQYLYSRFLRAAANYPERTALEVAGLRISYEELRKIAEKLAGTIQQNTDYSGEKATAIFAYRTATAYKGILGALLAGNAYVPLNRRFPVDRTRSMLIRSGANSVIVDKESVTQLDELLQGIERALVIITADEMNWADFKERWPLHKFISSSELTSESDWEAPDLDQDALAYILFTSGSTGTPKGVMVMQRNVCAYVDYIAERYQVTAEDRLSQMFDLTFDLSASDMFLAWDRGACVCCVAEQALKAPGSFIRDSGITIWFSVPSVAIFMKRLGMLKPNLYPNLRVSMFCGEALPVEIAAAWTKAAPNSIVENLYGPTELTIACTLYRWDDLKSPSESILGTVPIGHPFPRMTVIVVDENLREVAESEDGELLMTGPQLSRGYLNDVDRTKKAFVVPPGRKETFYRTGDRVRRSKNGVLLFLGRVDNQVKVLGYRVELGELEATARQIAGVDGVVAIPYPMTPAGAGALELFLQAESVDVESLRKQLTKQLPPYMIPRGIHLIKHFPLNSNGKFDRLALTKLLECSESEHAASN